MPNLIPGTTPQNPLILPPTITTSDESWGSPEGDVFTISMKQTTYHTNLWTQVRCLCKKYYAMVAANEEERTWRWAQFSESIRTSWATGEVTFSRKEGEPFIDRGYGAGFEVVVPPWRRRIVTEASTPEGMI